MKNKYFLLILLIVSSCSSSSNGTSQNAEQNTGNGTTTLNPDASTNLNLEEALPGVYYISADESNQGCEGGFCSSSVSINGGEVFFAKNHKFAICREGGGISNNYVGDQHYSDGFRTFGYCAYGTFSYLNDQLKKVDNTTFKLPLLLSLERTAVEGTDTYSEYHCGNNIDKEDFPEFFDNQTGELKDYSTELTLKNFSSTDPSAHKIMFDPISLYHIPGGIEYSRLDTNTHIPGLGSIHYKLMGVVWKAAENIFEEVQCYRDPEYQYPSHEELPTEEVVVQGVIDLNSPSSWATGTNYKSYVINLRDNDPNYYITYLSIVAWHEPVSDYEELGPRILVLKDRMEPRELSLADVYISSITDDDSKDQSRDPETTRFDGRFAGDGEYTIVIFRPDSWATRLETPYEFSLKYQLYGNRR